MESVKKTWYKRWWAIVLYIFVGLIILGAIVPDSETETSITSPEAAEKSTISTADKVEQKTALPEKNTIVSPPKEEIKPVVAEPPKPPEFKLGDKIIAGQFTWKITKMTKAKEIGEDLMGTFLGKKASGEFLIIDVEVENTGKSAQFLMDSFVKLVDDQDREFSPDTEAAFYLKPEGSALMFETINPGIIKKGKIVYDVPEGLKVVNARISDSLIEQSFYLVKLVS